MQFFLPLTKSPASVNICPLLEKEKSSAPRLPHEKERGKKKPTKLEANSGSTVQAIWKRKTKMADLSLRLTLSV